MLDMRSNGHLNQDESQNFSPSHPFLGGIPMKMRKWREGKEFY